MRSSHSADGSAAIKRGVRSGLGAPTRTLPLAKILDQHQVFGEVIHLSEEQRALVRRHVEAVSGVPIEREDPIDLSCSEAQKVDRRESVAPVARYSSVVQRWSASRG